GGLMSTRVLTAAAPIAAAAIAFLFTGQVLSDESPSTEATWSTAATGKDFSPSPRRRTPGRVVGPYEKWAGGRQGLSFPRSRESHAGQPGERPQPNSVTPVDEAVGLASLRHASLRGKERDVLKKAMVAAAGIGLW